MIVHMEERAWPKNHVGPHGMGEGESKSGAPVHRQYSKKAASNLEVGKLAVSYLTVS